MTDHIYGRTNILTDITPPHMLIDELFIYINYFKEQFLEETASIIPDPKREKYFSGFYNKLSKGIKYYREMDFLLFGFSEQDQFNFLHSLDEAESQLAQVFEPDPLPA